MPHFGDLKWNAPCGKVHEQQVYVNISRGATTPPVYTDAPTITRVLPSNTTVLSAAGFDGPAPEAETDGYITLGTYGKNYTTSEKTDETAVRGDIPRRGLYRVYYTIEKLSQTGSYASAPVFNFSVKSVDDRGTAITSQSTGKSTSWTGATTVDSANYAPTNATYGDVNFCGFGSPAGGTQLGDLTDVDNFTFQLREGTILMFKLKGGTLPGSTTSFSLQLKITITVLAV